MPFKYDEKLLVWGLDGIEQNTLLQAGKTARLPFVPSHVALMPDAHVGMGSTVGSVIPTEGAIIPSAIGVDIGCGMAALRLRLHGASLPDLSGFMEPLADAIPAGVGKRRKANDEVNVMEKLGRWPDMMLADKRNMIPTAIGQCGTLGSGNHFFELCVDEEDVVWVVLHSGSRGVGKQLAERHIDKAKGNMRKNFISLEDPALAYLVQGEPDFEEYIFDMLWAQRYAALNREVMLSRAMAALKRYVFDATGMIAESDIKINCHHNFTQQEHHHGRDVWLTRKGAIKAGPGDMGIIPGSMGTSTYIVEGLGNPASYHSCSHGAGRVHSRSKAKSLFSSSDLTERMQGRVWNSDRAGSLVDEIPDAYKDIDAVIAAQSDLVRVHHILTQVFNYKG
jgi:tRNA-splicing ligase RtcB